jgi:hypothetical protein
MPALNKIKSQYILKKHLLAYYVFVPLRDLITYLFKPSHWRRNWSDRIDIHDGGHSIDVSIASGSRVAVYVIYGEKILISSFLQLASLARCGFKIILVSNGPRLSNINLLTPEHGVIAYVKRMNIGQDIGAYKDVILWLASLGKLDSLEYLGLFNDTLLSLSSEMVASYTNRLNSVLLSGDYDAIGLYENHGYSYHLGTYYMILSNSILADDKFIEFWRKYRPISNRTYAIMHGELAFSRLILRDKRLFLMASSPRLKASLLNFLSSSLFNQDPLTQNISSNEVHFKRLQSEIASLIPCVEGSLLHANAKGLLYMKPFLDVVDGLLDSPSAFVERFIFELEHSNQSHTGALMFPRFLGIPFVKKDICLHGFFTISQVLAFFEGSCSLAHSPGNYLSTLDVNKDSSLECFDIALRKSGNNIVDSELLKEAATVYKSKGIKLGCSGSPCFANAQKGILNPRDIHCYAGIVFWQK